MKCARNVLLALNTHSETSGHRHTHTLTEVEVFAFPLPELLAPSLPFNARHGLRPYVMLLDKDNLKASR